ncbi:MAG: glycosyltransferase family 39 protein [Anaerolineales bacterium]|nr:glycosyltransferase family 39 protein [Anaerolineales bacterium]
MVYPLIFGLVLRIITSLWAAVVSPIRPLTPVEQIVSIWPPTTPMTVWLERVFLAPWLRWDANWYLRIITQGYRAGDGTANFQPLFPWLATPFFRLGFNPILSLLLISSIAAIMLVLIYYKLARLDMDIEQARISLLLLGVFPVTFILFAPYSESLFLLWAVLCLYWSRMHKWWLAGLAGALAALTRQQGIVLAFPLALELWQNTRHSKNDDASNHRPRWHDWMAVILIPTGLAIWIGYRALFMSDRIINPDSFQTLIYSLLISPSTNQVVPIQAFLWPWEALKSAIDKLSQSPDLDTGFNLLVAVLFLVVLVISWRKMRPSYRIYAIAITLISFSFHTGPIHPYMGLPRHLILAFPVFLGAAPALNKPWKRLTTVAVGAFGNLFALTLYVLEAWVP